MRPPAGRQFDMRPQEDGPPVENVRRGGFRAALIFGLLQFVSTFLITFLYEINPTRGMF